jgi:phage head maturation protease
MDKLLIAPITKIDAEARTVSGYATMEVPDTSMPIPDMVDYDSATKAFSSWVGNIREMHLPIAVGHAIEVVPDAEKRGIYITAKISKSRDGEDVWTKVQEGVTRTPESVQVDGKPTSVNRMKIQTIAEVSLVDNPACPGTFFDVVRSVSADESPVVGETPASPLLLAADVAKMGEASDIHRALDTLHMLVALIESKRVDEALGEDKRTALGELAKAFDRVVRFIEAEFATLIAPQGTGQSAQGTGADATMAATPQDPTDPIAAPTTDPAPAEVSTKVETSDATKLDIAEIVKSAISNLQSEISQRFDALAAAGKADLAPLSDGLAKVTEAVEAAKADLVTVTKRVETLADSPLPGGPILRPQDLGSRGIVAAEKGGAAPTADAVKAIIADLDAQIDKERDPVQREKLGQFRVQLSIKHGI